MLASLQVDSAAQLQLFVVPERRQVALGLSFSLFFLERIPRRRYLLFTPTRRGSSKFTPRQYMPFLPGSHPVSQSACSGLGKWTR